MRTLILTGFLFFSASGFAKSMGLSCFAGKFEKDKQKFRVTKMCNDDPIDYKKIRQAKGSTMLMLPQVMIRGKFYEYKVGNRTIKFRIKK